MSKLSKTNVPGLYKDPTSGMIINTNKDQLDSYRASLRKVKEQKETMRKQSQLIEDVDALKKDLSDIKSMLLQLVNKK